MTTIYLLNALPNVFLPEPGESILVKGITTDQAVAILSAGFVSHVGHESTADLLSQKLGVEVAFNPTPAPVEKGAIYVCSCSVPPRRLERGQLWTEEEILACPTKLITFTKE